MLGFLTPGPSVLQRLDWSGYQARVEQAVSVLACACGADPAAERERFCWFRERLGRRSAGGPRPSDDLLAEMTGMLLDGMPPLFELVLTHAAGRPLGFGYITQGRAGGSLVRTLGDLLAGSLQVLIESGGDGAEAALLADVFRLAFPNLAALDDLSPVAQGMIVGAVPAGARTRLKVYFNTRLLPGPHRERVAAILARCGLEGAELYDRIYAGIEGARFHGVGVDLDGDGRRRAKLYARLPRRFVPAVLSGLARQVGEPGEDVARVTEPAQELLAALDSPAMSDEVELACALSQGVRATAKLTAFFADAQVGGADAGRVSRYLAGCGYSPDCLEQVTSALAKSEPSTEQRHPLHGVGIEVPAAGAPKVNVYLQPAL